MENTHKNYLRQWREFRKMSQNDLADKAETTKSVISLLENEKRPLSSTWLRKFAAILDTQPGWILDHNPNNIDMDILEIWSLIDDKAQAMKVMRSFIKSDTDS